MALRHVAPALFRRSDDEAAFERLYERHVEGVYRYSLGMLGDPADAEDVTQTTFLNAYRAFKNGTRPEKPNSWLIAIAHNVCRQRFRAAQRRPREVAFDEGIGEAVAPEPAGPTAEELRRGLSQLPPNQRAALVMRELEGSSYAEIAGVLGVSVSALETLLFRARRSLREQLEEQISCDEAALAINRQLDGRLGVGERRALRAHLRACADCHSLAQSQRAQRRVLKSLVLVPVPLTLAHWTGAQSASAATGAGAAGLAGFGAATGGAGAGAGASSIALGGAAAKVAAVVAAGVVLGGGTYEGVKHVSPGRGAKAEATIAPTKQRGLPIASARRFETPKITAPVRRLAIPAAAVSAPPAAEHATQSHTQAKGKSASHRTAHLPPGLSVKQFAKKKVHSLRSNPPGQTVSAAHSASTGAHPQKGVHSKAAPQSKTPEHPLGGGKALSHAKSKAATKTRSHAKSHARAQSHHGAHKKTPTVTQTTTTPTETTETTATTETTDVTTTTPETSEARGNSGTAPRGKR